MIQNYYIEFAEKTYLKRNEQWLIVRLQGCIMWHFLDILQFSMLTNKTASYIFKKWESLEGLQAHWRRTPGFRITEEAVKLSENIPVGCNPKKKKRQ